MQAVANAGSREEETSGEGDDDWSRMESRPAWMRAPELEGGAAGERRRRRKKPADREQNEEEDLQCLVNCGQMA